MALYDPCSSRYLPGVQKSVRELLAGMGYAVEELRMNRRYAQCCSCGGLISTVNPRLAKEIRDRRSGASARDLLDEVRQVILHAEKHHSGFVDQESGHHLASLKIGLVTCWVEYEPDGDAYRLHEACSHRIRIVEEGESHGAWRRPKDRLRQVPAPSGRGENEAHLPGGQLRG